MIFPHERWGNGKPPMINIMDEWQNGYKREKQEEEVYK
jgi:hypothetical protein